MPPEILKLEHLRLIGELQPRLLMELVELRSSRDRWKRVAAVAVGMAFIVLAVALW